MKFNIRKKLVTLAVASAVSGGAMMMVAAPAMAMNVSQNGLGQVLLFPYYTVKNGFDTVLTVTNTSDKTAVFKIRWREALNSREVRDFNVILSPFDHWSGAVTATADGALFRTFDKSCTSPRLPGMVANTDRAAAGTKGEVAFSNLLFSGIYADGASQAMERTKEGYFEVILMGLSDRPHTLLAHSTNILEYNAKHVSNVPRDCAKVDALFLDVGTNFTSITMKAPENVLKGHVFYLNTANGTAIDAKPTAIENFAAAQYVAAPGDSVPDLRDGTVPATVHVLNNGVYQTQGGYAFSEDAVSALLSATSVINEFATGGVASTSWVVTFPTKHHYTDAYTSSGTTWNTSTAPQTAIPPFSDWFANPSQTAPDGKSCDNISLSIFNREEATVQSVDNTQFSPYNPQTPTVALCYEANVIDFNASSVFGAGTNRLGVDTSAVGSAGWAKLSFIETGTNNSFNQTVSGLPVIGFSGQVRTSGDRTTNYGTAIEHSYVRPAALPAPAP